MNCNFLVGQIVLYPSDNIPMFWVKCDGQSLDKIRHANVYSVVGDVYTVNQQNSGMFNLPDYNGKTVMQKTLGTTGGADSINLSVSQLPAHNHALNVTTIAGNTNDPESSILANTGSFDNEYSSGTSPNASMSSNSIATVGSGQAIDITPSFGTANYIIYTGV